MWAVLSDPALRGGGWQERVEEFYASGRHELDAMTATLDGRSLTLGTGSALDFGCGLGRITCALVERFDRVVGVDHSAEMIDRARHAGALRGCAPQFTVGDSPAVADGVFDLVWCGLVVQHQPTRTDARRLVAALADRVAPGGVLRLQVPVRLGWRRRLQPRRRLYAAGRRVGIPHDVLFHRLGLNPIRMLALDETQVTALLGSRGLAVVDIDRRRVGEDQVDAVFIARRDDSAGRR